MTATRLPRGSVFLVEDEVMIRMMVADMLEELGYSVAAEAGEINEAIRLAQSAHFDLAILDVNVNGKVISPVAELIQARKRPFIFYLHPWEVDPEQPRIKVGWRSRFRHYTNLRKTQQRLRDLVTEFRFTTVRNVLSDIGLLAA